MLSLASVTRRMLFSTPKSSSYAINLWYLSIKSLVLLGHIIQFQYLKNLYSNYSTQLYAHQTHLKRSQTVWSIL